MKHDNWEKNMVAKKMVKYNIYNIKIRTFLSFTTQSRGSSDYLAQEAKLIYSNSTLWERKSLKG